MRGARSVGTSIRLRWVLTPSTPNVASCSRACTHEFRMQVQGPSRPEYRERTVPRSAPPRAAAQTRVADRSLLDSRTRNWIFRLTTGHSVHSRVPLVSERSGCERESQEARRRASVFACARLRVASTDTAHGSFWHLVTDRGPTDRGDTRRGDEHSRAVRTSAPNRARGTLRGGGFRLRAHRGARSAR